MKHISTAWLESRCDDAGADLDALKAAQQDVVMITMQAVITKLGKHITAHAADDLKAQVEDALRDATWDYECSLTETLEECETEIARRDDTDDLRDYQGRVL